MPRRNLTPVFGVLALLLTGAPALAGVANPDLSVIGQPYLRVTTDPDDPDRDRPRLDPGETELVFDAYLNPYARGYFTLALAEEGMELEEGYFTLLRGLPAGLNLKGGKYRAGFGKLNAAHPHTYPFFERFRVLSAYLPGKESFNETGISLSERLPSPGTSSLTASVDWLQGDSFRRSREATVDENDPLATGADGDRAGESRPAVLGRLSAFTMVGERSGLEMGMSAAHGTNNVAAAARTTVWGADARAKLWTSGRAYLLLQAEALRLRRDDAGWDTGTGAYRLEQVDPWGWYAFADWNLSPRWNVGGSYERFQRDDATRKWDHAVGLFAGYALMEETTAFRLGWERFQAAAVGEEPAPEAVDTFTLRVIFSMGPHKAHQF
jgi:hypothetical protein